MAFASFSTSAVIGTGMMGPGIAVSLTLGGVASRILSRTAEGAARGLETARVQLQLLAENGLCTADQAAWSAAHLTAGADVEDTIAGCDIVVESAPEDLALKQSLFSRLDAIARPEAVLASNTSGLSITAIAERCTRPERVLTTHFWNPPHLMPLVEIVSGARTSPEIASAVRELLAACGKLPIVVKKDRPGQLGNRLQAALFREAIHIVAEGIAGVEEVDTAVRAGFGMRLPVYGVFEHMDAVGLDLAAAVVDYASRDLNNATGTPPLVARMIAEGNLGVKSGRGFYDWSKKDFAQVKARRDRFILDFLKANRIKA